MSFLRSAHYSGASSQQQSRNTGSSRNSSNTQRRDDSRRNSSTPQSSGSNARSSPSGARPKQYRVSPSPKKPLYMADSFSSLWEKITEGVDWDADPISLGFGVSGIISEANEAYEQKDEEKAFILYERYISLWFHIKESKEYTYLFNVFDNMLEETDFGTALDRIDELIPSLESRYSEEQVRSSQAPRETQAGQAQRQILQPLQPPQPAPRNVASSSSSLNSAGSAPSQTSTKTTGATPMQKGRSGESEHNQHKQTKETSQPQQTPLAKKDLHTGIMKGVRENLLCPICLDLFENAKSLPCGHAVCEHCIGEWVASKGGMLTCPTCKNIHTLPSSGVTGLASNFSLNNLVAEWKKIEEGLDSEVAGEDKPPIAGAMPSAVEVLEPTVATITSVFGTVTLQPLLSGVPSAETSFIEKDTRSNRDAKGSTVEFRLQLCDLKGMHLRGRGCDKVEATVLSPTNEKKNVSVSLMERNGDYTLSFIPSKVGIHLVEAYLNNTQVCGSPLKVIVHPSAKFDKIMHLPSKHPLDVVVHGPLIYATDDSEDAYFGTDWEGNLRFLSQDRFDEAVDSYALATSNNRFYITVPNKSCVHVYDLFGNCKNKFGKRVLEAPTGIAVSGAGMIYVADSTSNTIEVFRPNFSHMNSIAAGVNGDTSSLALLALNRAADRLVAVNKGSNCFKIFDAVNMNLVKIITTRVQQALAKPFGVDVDEDGNILVSVTFDPSMQKRRGGHNQGNNKSCTGAVITYNSEGYFLGKFGDNELKNPCGLCIVEDKVLVIDEGAGNSPSLKVYKL
ncbi:Tripartite motif-containing protein 2 [Holothuria leucospilota]|uniref:Tripartite motif-containing protein 2 n=1 Tax=Holothuria leucospilota TaxID=206669 RepID=A0A9Q1HCQ2_HOLLE|nr:Tripartite motif-containing protein 2 [Holothuria leucospilota]